MPFLVGPIRRGTCPRGGLERNTRHPPTKALAVLAKPAWATTMAAASGFIACGPAGDQPSNLYAPPRRQVRRSLEAPTDRIPQGPSIQLAAAFHCAWLARTKAEARR